MAKIINPTKVVTGKNTRFSYLIVNEPKAINGGTPKYSVSLIIPKSDTVTVEKIKAAIKAAYDEGQGKLKGNGKSAVHACLCGCGSEAGAAEDARRQGAHQVFLRSL